ncbi:hypothetical protein PF005_g26085 [Phytophthora fragariae]|uniref:Uncharacterized protein n=1 Tax=Phytophthora fragariae TaxID=53985 RepID=A0A6A4BUV3_9STRA|nr:hypothetical protein PF003_g32204 [Phytophthora fragariae]KAE8923163.1 hypothetical protein PF009_g26585 [Phytophthora fragariae]KAE8974580.1 hypothetical protein PF011_g24809 [Phytophthora fragariae]KAE9072642.1 hypothetical protein PF010_g25402 [Phytophthora fragariae]KAE9072812.1 hypothetical protein PF007_g26042 [Phytophthora fragariae]
MGPNTHCVRVTQLGLNTQKQDADSSFAPATGGSRLLLLCVLVKVWHDWFQTTVILTAGCGHVTLRGHVSGSGYCTENRDLVDGPSVR